MASLPTRLELRAKHDAFLRLRSTDEICNFIGENPLEILKLAADPPYRTFTVPKRNGEKRLIEDPAPPLKTALRKLNECLQAVYYFYKSDAAFGFLSGCADDPPEQQRSIVGNARQHCGSAWMLNMDLEDFFHAIEASQIAAVFLSPPFQFPSDAAQTLTHLCCYNGRLAMGAPTSPILSNFAAAKLDEDLGALSRKRNWKYTRYADDMTFSSQTEITPADVETLRQYFDAHGYENNEKKTRLMPPDAEHVVTGIIVGKNYLDLPNDFFAEIRREIREFDRLRQTKGRLGVSLLDWVEDYDDRIRGMLQFARQVLGDRDPRLRQATALLHQAHQRPVALAAFSWLDFPYY